MITDLMNQPLTVQTVEATTTDEYGNTVLTPAGSPVAVLGFLEQRDTVEFQNGRDTVVSKWWASLPVGTLIAPMDYINFQAQKFQVDGEPANIWNPHTKSVHHIECKLTVS